MTAQPGLGVTGNGAGVTTPIAHRLAQAGLVAKAGGTPNLVRAGVFYDGTVNIVTGTAGMSYDVAPFTAALTRGAGQGTVLLANDGTVNVATTAAPGSNSRIDIVYVWQREFSLDGTDSNPVIGVVQGTPAATPAAPSLAAFPGALELARITVPAGVTATNSGTTITQSARLTAAAGGDVHYRTQAALLVDTTSHLPGQTAYAIDTGAEYRWTGSAWVATALSEVSVDISTFGAGVSPLTSTQRPRLVRLGNQVRLYGGVTISAGVSLSTNILTIPADFRPTTSGSRFIGTNITNSGIAYGLLISAATGVVSLPSGYNTGSISTGVVLTTLGAWTID